AMAYGNSDIKFSAAADGNLAIHEARLN
ncbi:hypothetical protein Tco_1478263, partial [Tanacetum coccineum]